MGFTTAAGGGILSGIPRGKGARRLVPVRAKVRPEPAGGAARTMQIGVLTNLRAGRVSAAARSVRELLAAHRGVLHLETHSSDEVDEALAAFAREGVGLLVVNGGDGTLQRTLTRILTPQPRRWLPLVAPLRGGRTNTSALSLGAQRHPGRGLAAILEAARACALAERVHERPVMRAELGSGGVQHGMFFGAGMLYEAIRVTHAKFPEGRAQGHLGASLTTAALVARGILGRYGGVLSPAKVQVVLDGVAVQPQEFLMVMATTLDRLFLRMRPFWGEEDGPLRFSTIAARPRGLRNIFRVLGGGAPTVPDEGYISHNVECVALRFDGGLTVDGELFGPEPGRTVTLSAPDRVRFVRG
jgi:diacylglycerol kinase (ATP)